MEFLNFLEGLSPWWWVAFAFALGALEMATGTFVLIWVALSALVMAGLLSLVPSMSAELQVTVFATLSVILTFAGRYVLHKFGDGGGKEHKTLNQRTNHFIGRTAKVLEYANGEGSIEVEGMRWRARWPAGQSVEIGGTVRITGADGMVLEVENQTRG